MELQVVCAATSGKEHAGDALPKATKILEDRLHLNPSLPACSCQTHDNNNNNNNNNNKI
jgi:hypothetical protein